MTKQKHRRTSDIKDFLIDEIVASKPKSKCLSDRKQIDIFLKRYVVNVPMEDIEGKSPDILAKAAISHLDFGAVRKKGQPLLRIFNPTEKKHGYSSIYTFVEMVNDDSEPTDSETRTTPIPQRDKMRLWFMASLT